MSIALVPAPSSLNIADRLRLQAELSPHKKAVYAPGKRAAGRREYSHLTFSQLDRLIDRYAAGLQAIGLTRGMRTLLLVKPSLEFFGLTFALFRLGAVPVLLDPAMGKRNVLGGIAEVEPDAIVAIPRGHVAKLLYPAAFKTVKVSVVVGRKLPLSGSSLDEVVALASGEPFKGANTRADDTAAILFTSGSTGAPKGVVYTHGIFDAQVRFFERDFAITRNDVDLSAFPLFSLFSVALGASVVIPDMDATKPAQVDPTNIIEAIADHGVTYAFGSPAFWRRVVEHCEAENVRLESMTRLLMAGAPAPVSLLERLLRILPDGADVYTPYGATECLPITFPSARKVVKTNGLGTCVGEPLLDVRIIRITDEVVDGFDEVAVGEVGEIVVSGEVTTRSYFNRPEATERAKIYEGDRV